MLSHAFVALLPLLQLTALTPESLVEDVRKLTVANDNEQRFEALTALLGARNITYSVEPFTLPTPIGSEPRTQGRNIVVTIGEGSGEVVVGAHYDAARLPGGTLSCGAVDNAASSVMLVHLAEALRTARLPMRVHVAWFDMEELGLVGSARYVAEHQKVPIRAMLNFDINAYGDTVLFGPPAGGSDSTLQAAFSETCAAEKIDCVQFTRMPPGDDQSFGKARMPTLSIATLPAAEVGQLRQLLEGAPGASSAPPAVLRIIHTPQDVIEKVDGASIARMHRLVLAALRRMSAPIP
jgi:hypothetical protein